MPVDTYLKRKNLSRYRTEQYDGLTVHIAPALSQWAEQVVVDAGSFLFFWKRFEVGVVHRHQPT